MRVKRGFTARRYRKKILNRAKGFYSANSRCFSIAIEKSDRALAFQYKDRRTRKRSMRRLWIQRINAGARLSGSSYSKLIFALNNQEVPIDRKMLADLAATQPKAFSQLVQKMSQ